MNTNNLSLSVVIPAYNESKRILETLKKMSDYLQRHFTDFEILVIDDGSTDQTSEVIEEMNYAKIKVYRYEQNQGKGYAVQYGMLRVKGQYVLFADADNSTPIDELSKLMSEIDNYDVVIGSRYLEESKIVVKQSLVRIIGARIGNLLIRGLVLPGFPDTQCGFKLFQGDVVKQIFSRQTIKRWGFDIEVLYIAKLLHYRIKQVPVSWYNDEDTRLKSSTVFFKTLGELLKIKVNKMTGKYR